MAFLGLLKQLRARFGADAVAAALPTWGDELAAICGERLSKTEWYPYAAFVQLLEGSERDFGDGDGALVSVLGEGASRSDLGGGAFHRRFAAVIGTSKSHRHFGMRKGPHDSRCMP